MFILTNLFFYCSVAKADDSDTNIIELYDYETGQTSNVYIPNSGTSFLPASGIAVDTPSPTKIIGDDNQWRAPKSDYPYTAVMFLAILYDSGRISTGTGFLVGSNVMITAGHNFKTIFMKKKFYSFWGVSQLLVGAMTIGLVSCEKSSELLYDFSETSESSIQSRAISVADSVSLFSNIDEFKKKPETKSYSYYPETDEFYSSNMYAVRELPFALKVRGGGVVGQPYLSTQGMRKELILSAYSSSKFYLKILPPSSGIPYLIYSKSYNKPLVCGQYNNDPNNKLVFVWDSEDISSGSWDLIPSTYKGYFNIENQTYLGTADPNNPWSVFNYSIEVKSNGQVGYAKYNKQPQQEFLLEFQDKFKVKEIAFEPKAVVTELDPVVVYSNGQTGAVAGPSNITIYAKKDVKDTSCYTEKGALKIPMANEEQMFLRPAIIAGQFIAPGNFSSGEMPDSTIFLPRAPYTSTTYEIPKTLSVTIPVEVDEPSLIKVTTYLKKYSVKADYTITMTYRNGNEANDREVKFKGSWYGIINTTSKAKPDEIVTIPLEEYMKSLSNNNLQ